MRMRASVYVETSIVSYLSARPGRDVVLASHHQLTRLWWRGRRSYSMFASQMVLDEAAAGDPAARTRRLRSLRGIPILPLTDRATELAGELVRLRALPKEAVVDAFHIAIAADHHVDYLLTWNCGHIANATMRRSIEAICRSARLTPPITCTPDELPSGSSA
jgi:hypothetical protein